MGWLSTGIVQGSAFKILICCKGNWGTRLQENPQYITVYNYDTTHLQENPQRLG